VKSNSGQEFSVWDIQRYTYFIRIAGIIQFVFILWCDMLPFICQCLKYELYLSICLILYFFGFILSVKCRSIKNYLKS